jgi:hypothetical protein
MVKRNLKLTYSRITSERLRRLERTVSQVLEPSMTHCTNRFTYAATRTALEVSLNGLNSVYCPSVRGRLTHVVIPAHHLVFHLLTLQSVVTAETFAIGLRTRTPQIRLFFARFRALVSMACSIQNEQTEGSEVI